MTTTHNIFELFDLIGFRQVNSSDDEVVLELPVAPHVVNTNGGLQGGLLATLVDAAAGGLAMRQLAPGESVATSDLRRHRELRDDRRPPPTGVSQTIERSRSPAI